MPNRLLALACPLLVAGCADPSPETATVQSEVTAEVSPAVQVAPAEGEIRLANLVRLTDGGSNSEAYFSHDGTKLIFQATRPGDSDCDQIYTMNVDGTNVQKISEGGRTTCAYYYPSGDRILYSSTHHIDPQCPAPPDRSRGYVWPLHPYDIFIANPDGSDLRQLTENPGYDAEATISPDGNSIVFTSLRDGDVNIFVMDADGGNVRQLTDDVGYDGGAFFSADGSRIVYRAHHPSDDTGIAEYRQFLEESLVRPDQVELFVMDADGSNKRQVTDNGKANFAPFFHPNGRQIIFSSNIHDPSGRSFNLYLLDLDIGEIERVTNSPGFDSFPQFSPDGSKLVFASDRGASERGEFNIFVADWVE